MGLGYGEMSHDSTAGMAIGALKPTTVGSGQGWSAKDFRLYLNQSSSRKVGNVIDYQIRTSSDEAGVYDMHEIHASRNGLIYFTQQKHDRAGYMRPDGVVKLFPLPAGSRPHGIRLDSSGRLFVTLEYQDKLAELDPIDGTILKEFDISFADPSSEGVVGPHGLAIDSKGRLWYTGKSSDVLGWVDPNTGEQQRYTLATRANFGANFGHGILANASGPINIEIDQNGNAWFVNLLTSEIGRIDGSGTLKLFKISGLDSVDNTRPINVVPGPDGKIWVTVEGNNDSSIPSDSLANKGGIARFDPVSETFIGYQQSKSKGAGGAVGATKNSIWFQYQEQSLEELKIDPNGRRTQINYNLPDIGQRVMHRISRGPEGNMWFTSLMQDTVSVLKTANAGIPVYAFQKTGSGNQYLSGLPDEITKLQQKNSGYQSQEGLFLSALKNRNSVATQRFTDRLTGSSYWTIDPVDINSKKAMRQRYQYEGEDFRVYANSRAAANLIPIYRATNALTGMSQWDDDPKALSAAFGTAKIAWYAEPFPIAPSQF